MQAESKRKQVGLPARPFLYTMDQLESLLDLDKTTVRRLLFFEGRSVGRHDKHLMRARNIALEGTQPDWRVAEQELIRWMKLKGFKFYERSWPTS